MTVTVNGADVECADGTTVADLLAERLGSTRGSAAVVDGEVVPRSAWPAFRLAPGAVVEIITAVQGG